MSNDPLVKTAATTPGHGIEASTAPDVLAGAEIEPVEPKKDLRRGIADAVVDGGVEAVDAVTKTSVEAFKSAVGFMGEHPLMTAVVGIAATGPLGIAFLKGLSGAPNQNFLQQSDSSRTSQEKTSDNRPEGDEPLNGGSASSPKPPPGPQPTPGVGRSASRTFKSKQDE